MNFDKNLTKNIAISIWSDYWKDDIHIFSLDTQLTHNTENAGFYLSVIVFGWQITLNIYRIEKAMKDGEDISSKFRVWALGVRRSDNTGRCAAADAGVKVGKPEVTIRRDTKRGKKAKKI